MIIVTTAMTMLYVSHLTSPCLICSRRMVTSPTHRDTGGLNNKLYKVLGQCLALTKWQTRQEFFLFLCNRGCWCHFHTPLALTSAGRRSLLLIPVFT